MGNKNLADEIKDLLDQLGEGGRSIHALDKQRRMLEQEKEELQGALEEAEATLEMEENRVLRSQLELANVRQEIDRRVAEKEEEFNNTRKNHARAMESLGASIEAEQRAKGEGLRIKKQLEGEINELEIGLDHANKANAEGLKSIKRYQTQLRETIQAFEDEARSRAQITEQVGISERKAGALSGEVEESKALLDGANRSIRQLQNDIADSRAAVNNMHTINGRDMTGKRQLESSIHTLQAEVDGMLVAAKKAMVDAARLADELRAEQEHVSTLGTGKNSLSNALGELEGRLSDAENAALKGGKTAMAKLEGKIRELEAELASTQSRTSEAAKAFQRAERKAKELAFAQGEDKKNQDRMSELASKLQNRIKTYKQQIEEAEEIAALNLAKFRKAQQELEETEERAKLAMVL